MFPYLEQIQEYSLCVLTPTYHMILNYVNTICGIVFVHGHRSIKKRYRSRQCQKRIRRQHFLKISLPSQSISNYPTTFLC